MVADTESAVSGVNSHAVPAWIAAPIVVGAFAIVITLLVYCCCCKRKGKQHLENDGENSLLQERRLLNPNGRDNQSADSHQSPAAVLDVHQGEQQAEVVQAQSLPPNVSSHSEHQSSSDGMQNQSQKNRFNEHKHESLSAICLSAYELRSDSDTNNTSDLLHSEHDAIAGGGDSNSGQVLISDKQGPSVNQQPRDIICPSEGTVGNKAEKIELECAPLLPEGKEYHVYFLYRTKSSDKDWVINVVKRLENEGFKCGFHERDFMPGQTVISNITESLRKSLKVILVISPDFLQSDWTKYETELAKVFSMEQSSSRLCLIPVLLHHCKVPDCLQDLTYLDAQGEEYDWWPRLKNAITHIPVPDVSMPVFSLKWRFSGRTHNNEHIPWLLDLVLNPDHDLIVTDGRNKELKKFSLEGQLKCTLAFKTRPDCLALTNGYLVTVTFPHKDELLVVDTKGTLSVVSTIPFQYHCSGISFMKDGRLIICSRESRSVFLCSEDGKILQEIKNGSSGETLFKDPSYVGVVDNRTICVSDFTTQEFFKIIIEDNNTFLIKKYKLTEPRASCVVDGMLLVASSNIRMFTLDGNEAGEVTLSGVHHVRGLAFSDEKRLLAVTHKSDADEKISVYQVM